MFEHLTLKNITFDFFQKQYSFPIGKKPKSFISPKSLTKFLKREIQIKRFTREQSFSALPFHDTVSGSQPYSLERVLIAETSTLTQSEVSPVGVGTRTSARIE